MFPVLLRLLVQWKPAEMAQIAEAAELPLGEVERLFKTLPNPQLDDSGRLTPVITGPGDTEPKGRRQWAARRR